MRDGQVIKDTYALLESLIANCDLFRRSVPGPEARQYYLGAASALHWVLGKDTRPFEEATGYARACLMPSRSNPKPERN